MDLVQIDVAGLRSVRSASLRDCGQFNVLIGQNNSGKSTLLSAIENFYRALRVNGIASFGSPFSEAIDHYGRNSEEPIRISATFLLSGQERANLAGLIALEMPQVKQAAESLEAYPHIEISYVFMATPKPLAFLSKISLANLRNDSHVLLEVGEDAAREIAARKQDVQKFGREVSNFESLISVFDERMYRRASEGGYPVLSLFRESSMDATDPTFVRHFRQTIDRSKSYESAVEAFNHSMLSSQEQLGEAETRGNTKSVVTFAGDAIGTPGYVDNIVQQFSGLKVLYLSDRRDPIGGVEAAKLLQLKTQRGGAQQMVRIQKNVDSLLGVSLDAYSGSEDAPLRQIRTGRLSGPAAELDVDDFLVQANGSGVKEALRLVLDVEFEHPDVLLVEEPEVHLHPALETAMMRYLRELSETRQVFLTTHSTNFIDIGDVQTVQLVKKVGGCTEVESLDLEGIEMEVPRELGLKLSSVFMYDSLVFIEGPSDELVLRELASTLGINLTLANVGFVAMGGARNFSHYATEATLSLLSKRQVKSWFIIDRDERSDNIVERMKAKLGTNGELHVLNRREIENYLASPNAIASLLRSKNAATEVDANRISIDLDEVAESLRELSVAKRVADKVCAPLYPSRETFVNSFMSEGPEAAAAAVRKVVDDSILISLGSVEEIATSARAELDKNWALHKLSIAPGDELLDEVMKRYGLRYKKDRDALLLAEFLTTEEIPVEMADLLKRIGAAVRK